MSSDSLVENKRRRPSFAWRKYKQMELFILAMLWLGALMKIGLEGVLYKSML